MGSEARILIAVGGYGGMYAALRLEELLRPGEATVMVAGPRSYLTYQPLLAGAAAGNLVPRHVVVLMCAVLRCTQVIKAAVRSIDHGRRLTPAEGGRIRLDDGEEFPAGALVWTGGVAPSPLARPAGLLTDVPGRVIVSEFLGGGRHRRRVGARRPHCRP